MAPQDGGLRPNTLKALVHSHSTRHDTINAFHFCSFGLHSKASLPPFDKILFSEVRRDPLAVY